MILNPRLHVVRSEVNYFLCNFLFEGETPTSTIEGNPVPEEPALSIDDFVHSRRSVSIDATDLIEISQVSETNNRSEQDKAAQKAKAALEIQNEQLQAQIASLQNQLEEQMQNLNQQDEANSILVNTTMDSLEILQKEMHTKTEQENLIKKTAREISTAGYIVPKSNQSILLKVNVILKTLRKLEYPLKKYFVDSVPLIELDEQHNGRIILKGFPIHHHELNDILERLGNLVHQFQSSEAFYNQRTDNKIKSLLRTIHRVQTTEQTYWKPYSSSFVKLINKKYDEYAQKFQTYINQKLKTLLDICIQNPTQKFRNDIIGFTNDYIGAEKFAADIELLKTTALDEFIHEHILLQQKSTKTVPTNESVVALEKNMEKTRRSLKEKDEYQGCELKHFQMIASLLKRLMILYHCFLTQLPLFCASFDLLSKIETNTVITIETATGSGK